MTLPEYFAEFKNLLQAELFPVLKSGVGPLRNHSKLLPAILASEPLTRSVQHRALAPSGRLKCNPLKGASAEGMPPLNQSGAIMTAVFCNRCLNSAAVTSASYVVSHLFCE